MSNRPNLLFVFGDQWRGQAVGFNGNAQVRTPHLDALAAQSLHAPALGGELLGLLSVAPPSLLTGQHPLTHGVFVNDVYLDTQPGTTFGDVLADAGYATGWIGKWHVDGHGRRACIPPERRKGFDFWRTLECCHGYNNSFYYAADETDLRTWEGYDAFAQTDEAIRYMERAAGGDDPFALFLSWGPPHAPYHQLPPGYEDLYDPAGIELRPNVPPEAAEQARIDLAGYYAHCTALDECIGRLLHALDEQGLRDNTILVFTSDHGDMLGSQGQWKKQRPWEESISTPFLLHWPAGLGAAGAVRDCPIDAPDLMPTILSLMDVACPETVEGLDYAPYFRSGDEADNPSDNTLLVHCPFPFGQFTKADDGGREYRALRTPRYTYARDLTGPWLLYDNQVDPYQMTNLVDEPSHASIVAELDTDLSRRLAERGDDFLPGEVYMDRWGYTMPGGRGSVVEQARLGEASPRIRRDGRAKG